MSYRIYVNNYQCLGNNEFPEVLRKALNKQGAKIYPSNDYSFHDFEIKELQPIIEALEECIFEIDEKISKRHNGVGLGDYTEEFQKWKQKNYTYEVENMIEFGYMFITVNFLNAIKDDYEIDYFDDKIIYKIKEGHHVYMSGF